MDSGYSSSQLTLRPYSPQQQTEVVHVSQTQEEKLAAALSVELHDTSRQVQSLQAETESLRALVSVPRKAWWFLCLTLNGRFDVS